MPIDMQGTHTCTVLFESGFFEAIDYHFARFVAQAVRCDNEAVMLAAALASRHTRMGHVCFDLNNPGLDNDAAAVLGACPKPDVWRSLLLESGCVGMPEETKPLILDAHNS